MKSNITEERTKATQHTEGDPDQEASQKSLGTHKEGEKFLQTKKTGQSVFVLPLPPPNSVDSGK